MFVLIILYYKAHAGIVVVQYILPPSIGVVFVLIAVRTHGAQEAAARNYPSNGLYASWMSMEGRNDPLRRPHPMPLITTVTEQHHFDPVSSSKLDDSTRRLSDLYGTPQKKCSSETVSPV
ncbi:hypothetical protein BKA70DRAFT_1428934 [Coprinopsis sp. MPI-PUGE-AT-0042]|nr:hypothetical protein BKA70DRAFT_1428934 [Coprinopsis sp. MPI-PUGE-AT-0042]